MTSQISTGQKRLYYELRLGQELPHPNDFGEVSVCCPFHNDHTPSLSINVESWLWFCHACSIGGDVFELEMALTDCDFEQARLSVLKVIQDGKLYLQGQGNSFTKAKVYCTDQIEDLPKSPAKVEAVYTYQDANGTPRFEVVRKKLPGKQKSFAIRHCDTAGTVIYNKPPQLFLYRLPEVIAAQQVLIVEGEKCVEAVRSLLAGQSQTVATTNPFGAGKWEATFSQYLKGKQVAIFPDNDIPGRKHALQVAAAVFPVVASVRIVELPGLMPSEDIADYLAAHPALKLPELLALITGAPGWTPTSTLQTTCKPDLVCLATVQPEIVSFLWKPYVPLGKLTILEGDPAAGKTYIALDLCARITRGDIDEKTPHTVVYLTGEDDLADTIRPRFDSLNGDATRFFVLQGSIDKDSGQRAGVTLADIPLLETVLAEHKPALVVVDPIQAFLGKDVDFHRANEVRPILDDLRWLAESYRCAIIIIGHLSKATQARALYRGIGSVDLTAAARSVLLVGSDPRNNSNFALCHIKSSTAKRGASLGYTVSNDGIFAWTGETDLSVEELLAPVDIGKWTAVKEAEEFLKDTLAHGPLSWVAVKEKAEAEGIKEKTLRRAKKNVGVTSKQQGGEWLWELTKQADGQSSAPDAHT